MNEYITAFTLGNAAILANVCLLPLYPGMIAFLAGEDAPRRGGYWLGVPVLGGVITLNVALGLLLDRAQRTFADVLDVVLPAAYLAIAVLGVVTIAGRSPFASMSVGASPTLADRRALSAYLYGLMLAPMTLPCTGPIVLSAFVIGSVSGSGATLDAIVYFVFYSIGFGWPLLLLPLFAVPLQRRFTSWTTRNHRTIELVSGLVLVGIAGFGWWTVVRAPG